jgi:hypothetical protein
MFTLRRHLPDVTETVPDGFTITERDIAARSFVTLDARLAGEDDYTRPAHSNGVFDQDAERRGARFKANPDPSPAPEPGTAPVLYPLVFTMRPDLANA